VPAADEDYAFVRVEGEGVHEIGVGPVHAGIIEPGHFRFSVVGEKVLRLEQRLGYVHKGIERLWRGMEPAQGLALAGRVSGDSLVAYSLAWCLALEAPGGGAVPLRAQWLRAFALERERVANHLGDLGALGNDAAFAFGLTQFSRLKEDWMRRNATLFGHRFGRGFVVPGGVGRDIDAGQLAQVRADTFELESQVRALRTIYSEHAGLQDRFRGTGRVDDALARRLGLTGLAARASGTGTDLRATQPGAVYGALGFTPALRSGGDVAARVEVRFDEVLESLRLLRGIADAIPAGAVAAACPEPAPGACAAGRVEGWRGEVLVAIETGADGRIVRAHAHDPSWQNWPVLEHAVIGNIVPDFPLINKSFNLSYSGHDL
jgi:Ni,Fe-hydrogenase III large subunit